MTGAAAAAFCGGGGGLAFSAAPFPPSVSAYGSSGALANLTTSAVIATPDGGVAPYAYAWTLSGSAPYVWTINSPTADTTTFTCNNIDVGVATFAVFNCRITDAIGSHADITVNAFANNGQPYDPSVSARDDLDIGSRL